MPAMRTAAVPRFVPTVARCYIAAASFSYLFDLYHQTREHLTNGAGRPFGDDFVNFWSGAWLALHGHAAEVYSFTGFHAFEKSVVGPSIDFYHYSYPPVLLLLTAPLALILYVPALFTWLVGSWYAFYRALRLAMPDGGALLLALATPAVFIDAVGGQNGAWTAALLGGGLMLLHRRPILAGVLFGLLIFKPQFGLLLPVALLAGGHWRTIAAAAATVFLLLGATVLFYGVHIWVHYAANFTFLRHAILEDGSGVWHRFVSVFVAARRLGASVTTAYAIQAISAALACVAVARVWFRDAPTGIRNAVLVLGTWFATPYLQDYDLVLGAMVVVWLWRQPVTLYISERALQIACGMLLLLPFAATPLAHLTGLALGPFFIAPLAILALQAWHRTKRGMPEHAHDPHIASAQG
jgi:arabinofuranan 3-O-arabinosyltransferase